MLLEDSVKHKLLNNLYKYPDEPCSYWDFSKSLIIHEENNMGLVFSTHFSVFGYLMKQSSSCFTYYMKCGTEMSIPFFLGARNT